IDCEREVWLDGGCASMRVRGWRAGDRYQPLGMQGRKKLQDCFVDRGIERIERNRLPLVCGEEGDILWVPGLLQANSTALDPEHCKSALRLTYHPI
ncbi:MAG: tRNA lysidine(34) synthetase TilS, partial [Verrucomicrobia bacterium]|nr:tRNA lysidine(34) synthetase TilS [Verrucomicrobiota bacterium]